MRIRSLWMGREGRGRRGEWKEKRGEEGEGKE